MTDETDVFPLDSDALLMAYVDGELPLPKAEAIRRAAASDAALAARIALFQRSRDGLQTAFAPVLDAPVPDRLLALFDADARAQATAVAPTSVSTEPAARPAAPAPAPRAAAVRRSRRYWPLALAASVLVAIVVPKLQQGAQPGAGVGHDADAGKAALAPAIVAALDRQRSGEPLLIEAPERQEVMPVASLRSDEGRYCRDYELTRFDGDLPTTTSRARACHDGGTWVPVTRNAGTAVAASAAVPEGYEAASGTSATIEGTPLDPATEARLIEQHWQP